MARITQRKLFLFGRYSLALLPPKRWLSELGVNAGDIVQLEFDGSRKRIVVRLKIDEPVLKARSKPVKRSTENPNDPDWQPIPQI